MKRQWTLDEFSEAWDDVLERSSFEYGDIVPVGRKHEEGYGEISMESTYNIILQTRLNDKKIRERKKGKGRVEVPKWFLDFGSGIGNTVNAVAYMTPSICVGAEIQTVRSKFASTFSTLMDIKRRQKDADMGIAISDQRSAHITLYMGDGFLLDSGLSVFDVIFSNNLLFDEEMIRNLFKMVGKSSKSNALFVVTKIMHDTKLLSKYFTTPTRDDLEIVKGVEEIPGNRIGRSPVIRRTFVGFYLRASWTSNPVPYYITKVK